MKYIIVFINALAIAIYQLIFGDPVSVAAKIPDSIEPGKDFVIEVTINKAQVAGFAKLQLEIPPAFVATEIDSKGGSFSASGRIVKVIWTSVPADAELLVKINVSVPASAKGDLPLKGKFSYIENNVKQEAEFPELTIKLGGASSSGDVAAQPATEPATTTTTETVATTNTSTTDDAAQAFSKPNEPDAAVSVSRKINALEGANNFEVSVTIKKGAIKGFAKLSEKIPAGFKAEQLSVSGASFAFENGEAKFIWTSIPAAEDITVSYKLVPDGGTIENPSYIDGSKFSYIEGDQTKKIPLDKQEIATNGQTVAATNSTQTATEPVATNNSNQTTTDNNTVASEPAKEPVTTTSSTDNSSTANTTASAPKNANIHYSVQIGAFKNGVSAGALGRKYSISETIKTEMQDGFTKCVLGKFDEYKTARDNRENIKNKGVTDAFVTAYNSGKRITVQEALMVSNQKWYK